MTPRPINRVFMLLLLATAVTVVVGERGTVGGGAWAPVLLIFGLAGIKAAAVIWEFMEIRHAPALWKRLLVGWLVVVLAAILVAYAISLRG